MSEGKTKECGFFDRVRRTLYMIERELFRLLYIVIDAIVSYLRPCRRDGSELQPSGRMTAWLYAYADSQEVVGGLPGFLYLGTLEP